MHKSQESQYTYTFSTNEHARAIAAYVRERGFTAANHGRLLLCAADRATIGTILLLWSYNNEEY